MIKKGYTSFSGFFLAYMTAIVFLNIVYPPTSKGLNDITSSTSLYFLFEFTSVLLILTYSFTMAINDISPKKKIKIFS